ncbi:hypothetical protein MF271_04745 [Deinococcus sp. KNUC1210]|uniref:hypothetical protein n=1 Tax=Deinococcus sp. KNUC1210 TaxID=2917691 RepID=UPI001EF1405C|nr:hypothetical protein [Deinococcus sp. KNUC1210]ULH15942.1 hypothetical protein MF271_04745 [Deinococcus sp. KNUC1210]
MKNGMKMVAGGAVLAGLLASCGSVGGTGDGSASLYVSDVKTEYRTADGTYVGCDNVSNTSTPSQTTVATTFTLAGSISAVNVNLKGNSNGDYDNNYNATFYPGDITNAGAQSYKATFVADSSLPNSTGFLPQSVHPQGIVVNPNTTTYVKLVTTDSPQGSFRSVVTVTSTTGQVISGTANRTIPVYSGCNVISTTTETL